jgi:L,D-transpeptidase YcbB
MAYKIFFKALEIINLSMFILFLPSCGSGKNKQPDTKSIVAIYSPQNSTELTVDSAAINFFFKTVPASDSIKKEVIKFYKSRSYQFAWLSENGLTAAASGFYEQVKTDSRDFDDKNLTYTVLDTLYEAVMRDEKAFVAKKDKAIKLELLLTASFFKYARKMYSGITRESKNLEWYIPRKKKNYQSLLDSLISLSPGETLEEPVNEYYIRLKQELRKFRNIQKNGGLPLLVTTKRLFITGDKDSCLLKAKQHLITTGDLKFNDNSLLFTDSLMKAVKNYQKRMGLPVIGKINTATIQEMNKPIEERLMQIMVNMERLRWVPVQMEKDYLLVNIPEFKLHVVENNKQEWVTNVVVGKAVKQTSIFRDNVSQIIFNPYWDVPNSIYKKEIQPRISKSYLAKNNMERYNEGVRQKPGKDNALGKVKFLFPNSYNIYLHDTPSKNLFSETKRAFSHGCIRVENPLWLAHYLLRKDTSWTMEKINTILKTDKPFPVQINPVLPVYIAYFTAWVDGTGEINFRNDLYNLDKKLAKEIFTEK